MPLTFASFCPSYLCQTSCWALKTEESDKAMPMGAQMEGDKCNGYFRRPKEKGKGDRRGLAGPALIP